MGIATMGAGLLLATLAREPWQLYLTLGAMCGGGVNCFTYVTHSTYLPHWFVRRRGLAISIAFSGVGIGSITILPWLQSRIASGGWRRRMLDARHSGAGAARAAEPAAEAPAGRYRPCAGRRAVDGRDIRSHAANIVDHAWAAVDWTLGRALRTPASGGSRSAISAASSSGTRCRCTRPNT
jgi:hypothetical protein